jgi:hypothetical protein
MTETEKDETGTPLHAHEDGREEDVQGDAENPVGDKTREGRTDEPGQTQDGTPADSDGSGSTPPVEPDQEGEEADGLGSKTGGEGGDNPQEGA